MKLIKILTAFIALASLQIAAAQWLEVPPPAEAKNLMVFTAGVPVAAEVCNVLQQSQETATNDHEGLGEYTSDQWYAFKFVYSGTNAKGICNMCAWLTKVGTGQNVSFSLRGHDAVNDCPNSTVYSDGGTITAANITTGGWYCTDVNVTTALTNGSTYWTVFNTPATSSSNYIELGANGVTGRIVKDADGAGIWSQVSIFASVLFKIISK